MNAIIPLNVTALRVNANDNSSIVGSFAGATAFFSNMPYEVGASGASTGNAIYRSLEQPTLQSLNTGIHLHWELPDYFRRGVQANDGGQIVFPHAPNRWMVVRYLSEWDDLNKVYQAPSAKAWIVLSDAISNQPDTSAIPRPRVTVPLPVNPPPPTGTPPFKYMGKVLDYESWDPGDTSGDFLSNYKDEDGNPYYLTSIGFVGPSFSAYYPECCSVFGFLDNFGDRTDVRNAMLNNTIPAFSKFKVSYQVVGWINEAGNDPLQKTPDPLDPSGQKFVTFLQAVQNQYALTLQQYKDKNADLNKAPTPGQVFDKMADNLYKWAFPTGSLVYTLNPDKSIQSADGPVRALCNGIMQEIGWDFAAANQGIAFLSNPSGGALWTDTVTVSVGNTPTEAVSAMLKTDIGQSDDPQDLSNNEYLLDALQLGLLRDLEQDTTSFLFNLDEALHSRAFGRQTGGNLWIIKQKQQGDPAQNSNLSDEATLPLALAEQLHALNQAQKDYDQGRAELDLRRRQLFMDWLRYMNTMNSTDNFYTNTLPNFIGSPTSGELLTVTNQGASVGILKYQLDPKTGRIVAPQQPAAGNSRAMAVWTNFQTVQNAVAKLPNFELLSVPAPDFWLPTDPTVLVQGDRVEPARRNGPGPLTNARVTQDLITVLSINSLSVNASTLSGLPALHSKQPLVTDASALLGEGAFLMPVWAYSVGAALKALGGANNPASGDMNAFVAALQSAQGNWTVGFFAAVHDPAYQAVKNPTASSAPPLTPALSLIFTNTQNAAWAPDPVAWNAQNHLDGFPTTRLDPFIPVFLTWSATIDPLTRNTVPPPDPSCKPSDGSSGGGGNYQTPNTYNAANLTQYFTLDGEAIDNQYQAGQSFTTGNPVKYSGSAILSRTATYSLATQIERYIQDNPNDTEINARLEALAKKYRSEKMLSQALSGFNSQQILRKMIPQVPVQDLTATPPDPPNDPSTSSDPTTLYIQNAATANSADNWYNYAFNSEQPISGYQATANFGPLRAGFMEIMDLRFVDVFGQVMQMTTSNVNPDNSLQVIPSERLKPLPNDTANAGKVFLPPRLLMPSRLWFRWLSAAHNADLSSDFVEMNTHPSTSPVCGWVLPNHLDNSLMFYNADGRPIGSFGLEHGASVYRSRPGVIGDNLTSDIGPQGNPAPGINPHVANFMWFVYNKKTSPTDGDFLSELMYAIENSDQFIHSPGYKQASGLAVLIGRPLAITRAVASLESYGALAPLSQADTSTCDPFHHDVLNNDFDYKSREPFSSGGIKDVQFPLRLGELSNINDGLVGFLLENTDGSYQNGILYSAAAAAKPSGPNHGVVQPADNTIQLTLNAATPQTLTILLDPRCAVHATTGILPVEELSVPSDQFAQTMRSLGVTFFTHPVLEKSSGLVVPLPEEAGFGWSWIELDNTTPTISPLKSQAADEFAYASYSPQTLLEGWLGLAELPPLDLKDKGGN